jgi:hypothetical protein
MGSEETYNEQLLSNKQKQPLISNSTSAPGLGGPTLVRLDSTQRCTYRLRHHTRHSTHARLPSANTKSPTNGPRTFEFQNITSAAPAANSLLVSSSRCASANWRVPTSVVTTVRSRAVW